MECRFFGDAERTTFEQFFLTSNFRGLVSECSQSGITMTQRLLRLLGWLLFVCLSAPPVVFAQQQNPYKNLVTAIQTPVFDTISGVNLDVNLSNPQPLHGNLNITVIDPGGGSDPWVFQVQYMPDPGFIGVDSFVLEHHFIGTYPYLVYRGYRVSVLPSLVEAKPDYATTAMGTPVTISVLANDNGAWGPLTVACLPVANNGVATVNSNQQVVFTPQSGFSGVAHVQYSVCDALNTCKTGHVSIGVHGALPPTDTLKIFTKKNQPIDIPLTFEGYTVFQAPANGIVTINGGRSFQYVPNTGFNGSDLFALKTTYNGIDYVRAVKVKVYNTQSPNQMAMDDVRFTPKDRAITFNVRDNDIGNLSVRSWSVPSNLPGTITNTNSTGDVTFTPNPGYSGVATFFYKIGNASAPALEIGTVTIVVDNLAPAQVLPNAIHTPVGTPIILHYDIPYPDFSFTILETPDHGELQYFPGVTTQSFNGQSITGNNLLVFTPDGNYVGDDDFALFYCAPNGECKVSKLNIKMVEITATAPPYCLADCAWPGDVNADGIVNNRDLLPLGYVMGMDGTARVDGNLEWYGQYSSNWNDPFTGLSDDLKHADTDGNGVIHENDLNALNERYNQVHNLVPKRFETGKGLPFFLKLLTPNPQIGDVVRIEISLGNENFPAQDIYGFTFDATLGQGIVDSGFHMTFYDNSWLNLNAPSITLAQRPSRGRFEMAFSRTNGKPISGEGIIGVFEIVIIDIIDGGGQNERPTLVVNPVIELADGTTTTGEPIRLEIPIKTTLRNRPESTDADLAVFPSPAQDNLRVSWQDNTVQALSLTTMQGRLLQEYNHLSGNQVQLDVSNLPSGIYILTAKTATGVVAKKVEVMR